MWIHAIQYIRFYYHEFICYISRPINPDMNSCIWRTSWNHTWNHRYQLTAKVPDHRKAAPAQAVEPASLTPAVPAPQRRSKSACCARQATFLLLSRHWQIFELWRSGPLAWTLQRSRRLLCRLTPAQTVPVCLWFPTSSASARLSSGPSLRASRVSLAALMWSRCAALLIRRSCVAAFKLTTAISARGQAHNKTLQLIY